MRALTVCKTFFFFSIGEACQVAVDVYGTTVPPYASNAAVVFSKEFLTFDVCNKYEECLILSLRRVK